MGLAWWWAEPVVVAFGVAVLFLLVACLLGEDESGQVEEWCPEGYDQ